MKPKILIVDDKIENLVVLERILEDFEVDIIKANSGNEAVFFAIENDFALILMDVQMPEMDGFETVKFIRKKEKNQNIPIIFISAVYKDDYYKIKGVKTGAVDFLTKPIVEEILIGKVTIFLKQYEEKQKLNEYLQLANAANKAKSEFLTSVSHEIRTPMNGILGLSKLILDYNSENLKEDQKEAIGIIYKSGVRLMNLINDILDLSKVETGKVEVNFSNISVKNMFKNLKNEFLGLFNEKEDVEISFIIENLDEDLFVSDEKILNQILVNLIGNALKFTEKGKIEIKAYVEGERLYFKVTDTGIGIKKEDINKIFNKFEQVDNSLTKKNGTGIGLSLVVKFIELLNGELIVESEYEKGSVFKFFIKFEKGKIHNSIESKKCCVEKICEVNKKIIIAEDDDIGKKVVELLIKDKFDAIFVKNGLDVIEKTKSENPDLILMDIMMPKVNGFDALKEIRKSNKDIPIIALTARAMKEDKKKILDSGFDSIITKPINSGEFYEIINGFLKCKQNN